jgi:3-oxoadipate enol-lactonase/4-carboxymuconolactone decarboxylase
MFVRTTALSMHVQISGRLGAPVLIFLHSLGTNLHLWDLQAEALADRYRVLQLDFRGHGLTSVTAGPYTVSQLAGDVAEVMEALSVESAYLCGVSLGGAVALTLAGRLADRVPALILCDTATSFDPPSLWIERANAVRAAGTGWLVEAAIARWVSNDFALSTEADGMRAMLRRTDPEGYASAAEALAACDLDDAASKLRLPTLIVVAENDLSTPVETAKALRDRIPGAVLEVLPGRGHLPQMEGPNDLSSLISHFLNKLESAEPLHKEPT